MSKAVTVGIPYTVDNGEILVNESFGPKKNPAADTDAHPQTYAVPLYPEREEGIRAEAC